LWTGIIYWGGLFLYRCNQANVLLKYKHFQNSMIAIKWHSNSVNGIQDKLRGIMNASFLPCVCSCLFLSALAILLLPGGTSLWRGPYWDKSLKTGTFLVKILCLYIKQAASLFALGSVFSLALDLICTLLLIKTN
jgi:hypothetical protein